MPVASLGDYEAILVALGKESTIVEDWIGNDTQFSIFTGNVAAGIDLGQDARNNLVGINAGASWFKLETEFSLRVPFTNHHLLLGDTVRRIKIQKSSFGDDMNLWMRACGNMFKLVILYLILPIEFAKSQ